MHYFMEDSQREFEKSYRSFTGPTGPYYKVLYNCCGLSGLTVERSLVIQKVACSNLGRSASR